MRWDPVTTVRRTLWIGGGQWCGKTTVAGLLAGRHGLIHYHYDFHDARGHADRRIAGRVRRGEPADAPHPGVDWAGSTPRALADATIESFPERFEWVLDDLRALVSPHRVIADGWGLRPSLVAAVTEDVRQMVVMVPTDEFRELQATRLERARSPVQAARDRLVAQDAVSDARAHGIHVIEVDGSRDAEQVAAQVTAHFAPFLT